MANIPLKTIKFPGLENTYTVPQLDDTLAVTGKAADAKAVGDALAEKANVDGEYESMTVGNAEQLVSTVFSEDTDPYLYRTAGGSAEIGDREYDKIIGGTVAWNQLLADAKFINNPYPSVATVQYDSTTDLVSYSATIATAGYGYIGKSDFNVKKDHIYLLQFDVEATNVSFLWCKVDNKGVTPAAHKYANGTHAFIQKSSVSTNANNVLLGVSANNGTSVTATFSKTQIFDLTQMFGTTIADYIFSLEQATSGAGVAWFRKLFPKPYYEYNAGELLSVSGLQSHDMTGFNLVNFDIANFALSNTTPIDYTKSIRVISGMKYEINCESVKNATSWRLGIACYDASGNRLYTGADIQTGESFGANSFHEYYVQGGDGTSKQVYFTPLFDGYVMPWIGAGDSTAQTVAEDTCIHFVWDGERDGEYEEYKLHSYPLDSSLELRGIPKLDANNQLYYDGDTYESDGTVTRKYGIVDLGTLTWSKIDTQENVTRFISGIISDMAKKTTRTMGLACARFIPNYNIAAAYADNTIYNVAGVAQIIVPTSAYTDADAFKATMSGVYLVYELAEPTTETAEPYQNPQVVDNFGTEEYVTTSIVPVGHETKYAPNLRAKLETAPGSPNSNGDYIMRQTGGVNTYVPLVVPKELPANPGADGTYILKANVVNGETVLSWEVQS